MKTDQLIIVFITTQQPFFTALNRCKRGDPFINEERPAHNSCLLRKQTPPTIRETEQGIKKVERVIVNPKQR